MRVYHWSCQPPQSSLLDWAHIFFCVRFICGWQPTIKAALPPSPASSSSSLGSQTTVLVTASSSLDTWSVGLYLFLPVQNPECSHKQSLHCLWWQTRLTAGRRPDARRAVDLTSVFPPNNNSISGILVLSLFFLTPRLHCHQKGKRIHSESQQQLSDSEKYDSNGTKASPKCLQMMPFMSEYGSTLGNVTPFLYSVTPRRAIWWCSFVYFQVWLIVHSLHRVWRITECDWQHVGVSSSLISCFLRHDPQRKSGE